MLLFDKKVTLPSKSKYFCFKENKSTTTIGKDSSKFLNRYVRIFPCNYSPFKASV